MDLAAALAGGLAVLMPRKFASTCDTCPPERNRVKSRFRTLFDAFMCDECFESAYHRAQPSPQQDRAQRSGVQPDSDDEV